MGERSWAQRFNEVAARMGRGELTPAQAIEEMRPIRARGGVARPPPELRPIETALRAGGELPLAVMLAVGSKDIRTALLAVGKGLDGLAAGLRAVGRGWAER